MKQAVQINHITFYTFYTTLFYILTMKQRENQECFQPKRHMRHRNLKPFYRARSS